MLSTLELLHVIESALLPLTCTSHIDPSGSLQIRIFNPDSGRVELLVMGPPVDTLNGREPIAKLILEIRNQFEIIKKMRESGNGSQIDNLNER